MSNNFIVVNVFEETCFENIYLLILTYAYSIILSTDVSLDWNSDFILIKNGIKPHT